MTTKMVLPPFVEVTWDDAWKSATDETTMENVGNDHKATKCINRGWLLRDDEEGVQIAAEHSPDGTFRHRAFIPRKMVVDVDVLRVTKTRKKKEAPIV